MCSSCSLTIFLCPLAAVIYSSLSSSTTWGFFVCHCVISSTPFHHQSYRIPARLNLRIGTGIMGSHGMPCNFLYFSLQSLGAQRAVHFPHSFILLGTRDAQVKEEFLVKFNFFFTQSLGWVQVILPLIQKFLLDQRVVLHKSCINIAFQGHTQQCSGLTAGSGICPVMFRGTYVVPGIQCASARVKTSAYTLVYRLPYLCLLLAFFLTGFMLL